ncbi:hypothetical protein [Ornithinimicrobium sp. Y1694]|uniref:hypothetical protein n=1 Tax=Ornithinimicrobium sp. Y1694 TaxID=3418590 RepID=UPI003CEEDEF9
MSGDIEERVETLMRGQGGVASAGDLHRAGITPNQVCALVRRRVLTRVRRDALILAESAAGASDWEVRRLRTLAVGRSLARWDVDAHAISHASALMVHGLRYHGNNGFIHLSRTDGRRGRRDEAVHVHVPIDPEFVLEVDGLQVVSPVVAALQVAAGDGIEAGIVALDGVLHHAEEQDVQAFGRRDGEARARVVAEVEAAVELIAGLSITAVQRVIDFADGRSASVGESRLRWQVHLMDLGPCTPQFEVRDDHGVFLGRVDLKLDRWKVLLEFDGRVKYGDDSQALFNEKLREDDIRDQGYEVVRISWADLRNPQRLRAKIAKAIARAQEREAITG